MAEVLVYDRPLNGGQRKQLSGYVRAKYTEGHKVASLPREGLRFWLD
ncbi:MAG: hypothetical protein GWO24_09865, partial [Akkermansiaceae bacterium]|nr:hypothetical protein [Akkermansiaceae bacterium]